MGTRNHAAITQFAAWIGAVVSTYQSEDKIWCNVLHGGEMQLGRIGRLVLVGLGASRARGLFRHRFAAPWRMRSRSAVGHGCLVRITTGERQSRKNLIDHACER